MKHRRLILAAILALCSFSLWAAKKELPPAITETEVWFDDVKTPMALTAEQGLEITKKLREALLAKKSIPDTLAAVAFQDNTPRVLFITLGDGSFPGRTYYASGASFQDTLARLLAIIAKREPEYAEAMRNELEGQISRAKEEFARLDSDAKRRNMLRNNPLLRNPLPEPIRRKLANPLAWNSLRLDVVQATIPIRDFVISKSRLLLTSAVGIAFDPVAAFAFTPEQLTGRALMNDERQLSVSAIANLVNESNLWSAGQLWMKMGAATTGFNVSIFESDSYYADSKGAARLFRGHPVQCRLDTAKAVLDSATALAAKLRGMLKENGRYDRPFLEWVPSRTDGKPAVSDQAQLVLALLRTASLPEMPKSQRESLLSGAAAAAKPILKALKHFDPEELVPDFTASTAERKPAAERFFAAIVEEESVEDDSAISGNQ
ncbi:MAG: hypothetical protein J6Y80_07405, partial [Victivallales bacterium]|nr:hypothetical protein [Victivallales bacterium]